MRRITLVSGIITASLVLLGLYFIAGRNPSEVRGFLIASVGKTIDGIMDQIPNEVHDRKLDNDLAQVRQEVIDRQVKLGNCVRLLDFGTSRRANAGYESVNSVVGPAGTPTFVPDSQLLGQESASIQTDIQAVSAVAYTLLTDDSKQDGPSSKTEALHRQTLLDKNVPASIADIIVQGMRSTIALTIREQQSSGLRIGTLQTTLKGKIQRDLYRACAVPSEVEATGTCLNTAGRRFEAATRPTLGTLCSTFVLSLNSIKTSNEARARL